MSQLLVLCGLLTSSQAWSVSPYFPSDKQPLSISLDTQWYDTQYNYLSNKAYDQLLQGNSFQYLSLVPEIKWAPFSFFSLNISSDMIWARSRTREGDQRAYLQIFQLKEAQLGLNFHYRTQRLLLSFGSSFGMPFNSFTNETTNIVTGDGAYFVEPNFDLIFSPVPNFLHVFYNTSLKWRTKGLSTLFYSELGSMLETRYVDLVFSGRYFMPFLILDKHTKDSYYRTDLTDRLNGGSYKFYSVNPQALSFRLNINVKPARMLALKFYAELDTFGQNYAKGYTLGLITETHFYTRDKQAHLNKFQRYQRKKRRLANKNKYLDEDSGNMQEELQEELYKLR